MKLEVRAAMPNSVVEMSKGRWRKRWIRDEYASFQITPVRLIGPERSTGRGYVITAEAHLPEKYERYAGNFVRLPNGNHLFTVYVNHNAKTLAPFLASGLDEMDVREI
ncbi:hypothetical protein B0G84_5008 [Paraburkholderia sp. BL8N3]|nr:hypothetical protein [Paraburkholderia sp. BL8N3]TCK39668.1 hypothetical protein B0G84_5008 [Paraburkholderia sp. BL8N3]